MKTSFEDNIGLWQDASIIRIKIDDINIFLKFYDINVKIMKVHDFFFAIFP